MNIPEHIADLVRAALDEAQASDALPRVDVEDIPVERPQNPEHGDFACTLPLKLARPMRMNPTQIAETLASLVPVKEPFQTIEAVRPGFVNFTLGQSWFAGQVAAILDAGATYGNVDIGAGERVQVEFVSGNPTGPLHLGNVRGAVLGSALANILEAAGFKVEREYYVNDAGNQIEQFGASLFARYQQAHGRDVPLPPDGYQGQYVMDLAQVMKDEQGEAYLDVPTEEAVRDIGVAGLNKMLDGIREDVEMLRVKFDGWFSERSLYDGGQYERSMQALEQNGYVDRREGAVWFSSTALGEEKDNVLVRSNSAPTYFASDVAYHYNKFVERGFDHVIDILGADHQGHVPRMKAVVGALGVEPERLTLIIYQLVTLKRGGEIVRLSKRTGDIVTMRELVEEVGADACRFFFLSRSAESQMEFDLELAKQQSSENPVYYVQYAHARIAGILKLAAERGIDYADGDLSLLTHEAELALIRKMLVLPELVEMMTRSMEPHHLPHYAVELATAFHWFYQNCRVVSSVPEEAGLTKARLMLAQAAKTVLARCLELMIMDAPEEM